MAEYVASEDCQGQREQYWRAWRTASNGDAVCGIGTSENEANAAADANLQKLEKFLSMPAKSQVRVLLENQNLSPRDMERIVRVLAQSYLRGY